LPIHDGRELVHELSDAELAEELVIAAMARNHRRIERFAQVLAEQRSDATSGQDSPFPA
jgi:hypothetical protein